MPVPNFKVFTRMRSILEKQGTIFFASFSKKNNIVNTSQILLNGRVLSTLIRLNAALLKFQRSLNKTRQRNGHLRYRQCIWISWIHSTVEDRTSS